MSNTVLNSTTNHIRIREFSTEDVNFRTHDDLQLELSRGGYTYAGQGGASDHVLVTNNVDDCGYCNVQVSARDASVLTAIDAAIENLIVARDSLRKMEAAA